MRAMVSTLPSKLFSSLFNRLEENAHLTILDIGPAVPETLNFFSQFKCRLYFADLFAEPLPEIDEEGDPEQDLYQHFTAQLNLPADAKFDICLFWDFLNYLDKRALQAFSKAMAPHLHKDTRAHGFGVINSRTLLANHRYGIQSEGMLTIRDNPAPQKDYFPHPQKELNERFDCFNITKGVLMKDGRLEILLQPSKPPRH